MSGLGEMTDADFERRHGGSTHPLGCTYGGFSCGFWLIVEGCELDHWERHIVGDDDHCPCGTEYPGAGRGIVFYNANDKDDAE